MNNDKLKLCRFTIHAPPYLLKYNIIVISILIEFVKLDNLHTYLQIAYLKTIDRYMPKYNGPYTIYIALNVLAHLFLPSYTS